MNKLTLGTAQLGMDYGISNQTGKPSLSESLSILEYAYNHNIKSLDTASAYGNSEVVLGTWLKDGDPKIIELNSKVPSLKKQDVLHSQLEKEINYRVEHSLKNLSVKKIDHYLIHDFNDVKYYGREIFDILEKLKNKNLIGSYGCSIYDLDELEFVSQFSIGSIQIPGSIFNQKTLNSELLGQLRRNGTTVFVRSAFVQGLIFMKDYEIPKKLSGIRIYLQKLRQLAQVRDITIAEVALNYVRNHPNTDSVVFGVETMDQLKEIISINNNEELNPADISKEFSEIPLEIIDPRYWR